MRTRLMWLLVFLALTFSLGARPSLAEEPKGNDKDKEAIAKNADAFVEAFHKANAKALAAFWAPDGDYTDQTGRCLKGRAAIEKAFKDFFAENKDLKLRIDSLTLRFVTPDVAIEDGITAVIPPDGTPPSRARYTIVHVKKDGEWKLESVRDAVFTAPTNHEQLRALDWAIGDWAEDTDKGEVGRLSFGWSESQNFLVASYATTVKNITLSSGTQWIGWDPMAKKVRSWTFDNNGSFGEGSWSRDGNRWVIKTTAVSPDGKKLTATNIVTRINADTLGWQSRDRTVDGKAQPDGKEIKLKRVK